MRYKVIINCHTYGLQTKFFFSHVKILESFSVKNKSIRNCTVVMMITNQVMKNSR